MFYQCPLESVVISRPLDYSHQYYYYNYSPFYGLTTLNSASLSENVKEVGPYLFAGCSSLKSITIPSFVTTISEKAFYGCKSLFQVTLGESLSYIDGYAFTECPITEIYSLANEAPNVNTEYPIFDESIYNSAILKIPEGSIASYNKADVWKNFFNVSSVVSDDIYVHSIFINTDNVSLKPTETIKLSVSILPENAANKSISWISSDGNIASVDENGLVTALASGSATITATTTDGSQLSVNCTIHVSLQVASIVLNETEATLSEGQTVQLSATVSPELADNKALRWSSSDESVATVDQTGLVTAVAQGNAVVTVSSTDGSDVSATCKITVTRPVSSITLSETEIVMSAGEYRILTATAIPSDATNKTLIWTSSNEAVARVENGIVVAVADGESTVTVSACDGSDVSASCHVTVRTLVTEIILSENNIYMKEGEFREISATVLPDDATNAEIVWASSDESVATVQNGLILARKLGSAIIRVEATDGSGVYAECMVEVADESGISGVAADGIYITTEPLIALVHGTNEDTVIRLLDMGGKVLYIGNNPRIEVAHPGVYILVVNDKTFKIKL